jgi:hypothetical protein
MELPDGVQNLESQPMMGMGSLASDTDLLLRHTCSSALFSAPAHRRIDATLTEEIIMSSRKPHWEPKIERAREFNPFAKVDAYKGPFTEARDLEPPMEDTAPLQGSKDLSDQDSLQDVIADAYEQQPGESPKPKTELSDL